MIQIQIIILIILILLSGFFSSAETALSTVNQMTLRTMAGEGDKRAAEVLNILAHYSKMLSTILICNNAVNISASSLFTAIIISRFGTGFISIGTIMLTVLVLLLGEITPKNIAKIYAGEISLAIAPVIHFLMILLTPVIMIIDLLSGGLLKLLGLQADSRKPITASELKTYVEAGQEDGVIQSGEKKIIYNVFDFGDSVAKDIMIPRIDMTCVSTEDTYEEILQVFRTEMFTRLPVYQDDPDNIIGLINIKDFILISDPSSFSLQDLIRPPFYTYEYKKTNDLLKEMQQHFHNMAFVLNEFGSSIGMITLEDIVEEIVGEIRDEYDESEQEQIRRYDDLTYLAEASMKLDDINEAIGSDFDSEDFDSIGGLMIEQLDRLPRSEEIVTLPSGTTLQAKGLRQNRIVKVLIRFRSAPSRKEENASANLPEES